MILLSLFKSMQVSVNEKDYAVFTTSIFQNLAGFVLFTVGFCILLIMMSDNPFDSIFSFGGLPLFASIFLIVFGMALALYRRKVVLDSFYKKIQISEFSVLGYTTEAYHYEEVHSFELTKASVCFGGCPMWVIRAFIKCPCDGSLQVKPLYYTSDPSELERISRNLVQTSGKDLVRSLDEEAFLLARA